MNRVHIFPAIAIAATTIGGISLNAEASTVSTDLNFTGSNLLTNGGFETGNFFGWSTVGNARIETAAFGTGPTEGVFQALLSTGELFLIPL